MHHEKRGSGLVSQLSWEKPASSMGVWAEDKRGARITSLYSQASECVQAWGSVPQAWGVCVCVQPSSARADC